MKRLLGIYFLLHLMVDTSQAQQKCFDYQDVRQLDAGVSLEFRRNGQSLLFTVIKDKVVHDELIVTNSDLNEGLKLREVRFDSASENSIVYVLETYVFGSTFGANTFVIIWKDGLYWRMSRDYFGKSFLVNSSKDGFCKIEVLAGENKGQFYRFSQGRFIETQ